MSGKTVDELAEELAHMDRRSLIRRLRSLRCSFELDFTDEFLQQISLERLRHIILAASLHSLKQTSHRPDSRATC